MGKYATAISKNIEKLMQDIFRRPQRDVIGTLEIGDIKVEILIEVRVKE
jgi:hypothetical protein